jgi:tRNA-dihydrouridine synthase B
MLHRYLCDLLPRYCKLFCGEAQVLGKIKGVVSNVEDPELERELKRLTRSKSLAAFREAVAELL